MLTLTAVVPLIASVIGAIVAFRRNERAGIAHQGFLPRTPGEWAASAATAVFAAATIWALATRIRRYVRRTIAPLIAQALARLSPSQEELRDVLDGMRSDGSKLAGLLSADRLTGRSRIV